MCYFLTHQSIYLSCLPACLPVYSNCLFNPPIQPISYNKYARRCYFSTYQSSIYPTFLSNLPVQSAYSICLSNLPTQSACPICLSNLPVQSAYPVYLSSLLIQSAFYN